jgi:hypothetical protein
VVDPLTAFLADAVVERGLTDVRTGEASLEAQLVSIGRPAGAAAVGRALVRFDRIAL